MTVSLAQKACQWHDNQGYVFDLAKLHRPFNYEVPDTDTSMGMFNMVYQFNFCGGQVKCQGRDVAAFEALQVMGKITDNCDVLGMKETQEFSYLNPTYPELGIAVTYKQGDMCFDVKDDGSLEKIIQENEQMSMSPRSVTFEVTCGHDEENFKVIDSSKCNIRLGITHSMACRSGSAPSPFSKTVLFYLLIVTVVYIGGGVLYNKRTHSEDTLPHAAFWREFPLLVKDGVNYSLIRVVGLVKKFRGLPSEGGYATV